MSRISKFKQSLQPSHLKNKNIFWSLLMLSIFFFKFSPAHAVDLKVGDPAPNFTTKTHEGQNFELSSQKGHYTVLFFYPKAGTPGCTTQACAFRDNIKKIKDLGAEVYGISADSVADQMNFHKKHHLLFTLLADPDDKIIEAYGSKMPILKLSKRWTFILDENLIIRAVEKDVDPSLDAQKVAEMITKLKAKK
jgi:peroxiredoxin Q/BCP